MIPPKATLTFNEITALDKQGRPNPRYPKDGICKSGHVVPGARFFFVGGKALPKPRWGIYCENCMAVAFKMAEKQRGGQDGN